MSKNLKKILVTGASLLMFASVGAGVSGIKANAKVVDGVHVANNIPNSALRKGGEYHQEFEFELAKLRQHRHHRSHSVKRHRTRRAKSHARKHSHKQVHKAKRIKRTARKHRSKRSKAKRYSNTISMNQLSSSHQGQAFGIGVPANKDVTNILGYLPVNANSKFNRSYLKSAYYAFKNGKHQNARKAHASARLSRRSFDLVNKYAHHSNANLKYITAWGMGFDADNLRSNAHFPHKYNKYKNNSKFMQAFALGYMANHGMTSKSQTSNLFEFYESLFN